MPPADRDRDFRYDRFDHNYYHHSPSHRHADHHDRHARYSSPSSIGSEPVSPSRLPSHSNYKGKHFDPNYDPTKKGNSSWDRIARFHKNPPPPTRRDKDQSNVPKDQDPSRVKEQSRERDASGDKSVAHSSSQKHQQLRNDDGANKRQRTTSNQSVGDMENSTISPAEKQDAVVPSDKEATSTATSQSSPAVAGVASSSSSSLPPQQGAPTKPTLVSDIPESLLTPTQRRLVPPSTSSSPPSAGTSVKDNTGSSDEPSREIFKHKEAGTTTPAFPIDPKANNVANLDTSLEPQTAIVSLNSSPANSTDSQSLAFHSPSSNRKPPDLHPLSSVGPLASDPGGESTTSCSQTQLGSTASSFAQSALGLSLSREITALCGNAKNQQIHMDELLRQLEYQGKERHETSLQMMQLAQELQQERAAVLQKELESKRSETLAMMAKANQEIAHSKAQVAIANEERSQAREEMFKTRIELQQAHWRIKDLEQTVRLLENKCSMLSVQSSFEGHIYSPGGTIRGGSGAMILEAPNQSLSNSPTSPLETRPATSGSLLDSKWRPSWQSTSLEATHTQSQPVSSVPSALPATLVPIPGSPRSIADTGVGSDSTSFAPP